MVLFNFFVGMFLWNHGYSRCFCVCSVIKNGQAIFPQHGRKKGWLSGISPKKKHLKPWFFLKITIKSRALPKLVGVSTEGEIQGSLRAEFPLFMSLFWVQKKTQKWLIPPLNVSMKLLHNSCWYFEFWSFWCEWVILNSQCQGDSPWDVASLMRLIFHVSKNT